MNKKRILSQIINVVKFINLSEEKEPAETYATAAIHFIGSIKDMLEQDLTDFKMG